MKGIIALYVQPMKKLYKIVMKSILYYTFGRYFS